MSASIFVSLSELKTLVSDARRTGSNVIRLTIEEADKDLPACLSAQSCNTNSNDGWYEFEEIDELENSEELTSSLYSGYVSSSNLL